MTHVKRQEALAHLFGIRAETISAGEAAERWPMMRDDDVLGAVWSPDDGRVSPSDLCAGLIKGAKAVAQRFSRILVSPVSSPKLAASGRWKPRPV